jgi:hypothetical protein
MTLNVIAVPSFSRTAKRLHPKGKAALDQAVKALAGSPLMGEQKRGDLGGVFVHKFKVDQQERLLVCELSPTALAPDTLVLLALGAHENFYSKLKR